MLYVLTDSGIFNILYLCQNGVFPDKFGTKPESIKDDEPFLSEEDEIVIITQGLIDWDFIKLFRLVGDMTGIKLKSFRVFSNIELPLKDFDYTLVQGDLFYGKYIDIKKGRWGKPYKACFGTYYKNYDMKKEPVCIDKDEILEEAVKVNNEVPLHLVKVDIRKGVNGK